MVSGKNLRNLAQLVLLPFHNLLPNQRVLQIARLGTSFVAVCLLVLIISLKSLTKACPIARINCSHLDVAYGLYNSLRTSISSSAVGSLISTELSLTDSEIEILTDYTQSKVASAPQYLLLGPLGWCRVDYETNYLDTTTATSNETTSCYQYNQFGLFDYRSALLDNGLTIILAYAYESKYGNDPQYDANMHLWLKQFRIMNVVTIVVLVAQVVVLVSGCIVYGNRGDAKDLSRIPKATLNAIAIVSVVAGVCMAVVMAIIRNIFAKMRLDILSGIGSFGITMTMGKVYFCLLFLAFALSATTMLTWIVPLWCSNPQDDGYASDDEFYTHDETAILEDRPFVAKPYTLHRQTRTASRLFDDVPKKRNFTETLEVSRVTNPFDTQESLVENVEPLPTELSSKVHSEWELRKLGEKMSRSVSVRKLNKKPSRPRGLLLPLRKDTQTLLYSESAFSTHQYPQAFPKPLDEEGLSRAASLTEVNRQNSQRTRLLMEKDTPPAKTPDNPFDDSQRDDAVSVLNDDEIRYLDGNNFINHLG